HGDGLVQESAAVLSHVQNQPVESGRIQLLHRVSQLPVGLFVESRKADVTDAWLDLKRQIYGMMRDFVPLQVENQRLCVTFAGNRDLDRRASRSPQKIRNFRGAFALRRFVINADNDVARPDSRPESWRARVRGHYNRVVPARNYSHPHAVVPAA